MVQAFQLGQKQEAEQAQQQVEHAEPDLDPVG